MNSLPPSVHAAEQAKDLLRFLTCGSVDDGKSTLIGRLLYDSKLIFRDQLSALARDSERYGGHDGGMDFALLVDGLEAEREQGITIDVAYRYFATAKRSFMVADTPGHEQYTRNMATGASNAELAVILVDARKGILTQTRRHSHICALLGIRHVVLAVNKMDLVGYSEAAFRRIETDYEAFAGDLDFVSIVTIPISARLGDNVTEPGSMPWYNGKPLLSYLEEIDVGRDEERRPFRLPVQWVNRAHPDFRGYAGTIASGRIAVDDPVMAATSGRISRVKDLLIADQPKSSAHAGEAVTVTLTDELDIGRGDMLVSPDKRPEVSDQFAAHVIWMNDHPLIPGRSYLAKIGPKTTPVVVTSIKHKIDVNSREKLAAESLALNDIGVCNLATTVPVPLDPYRENRRTGCFILIDRFSNETLGAGMIDFGLRRGLNLPWQALSIGKAQRAAVKNQRPAIVWFTGLSGSGKSTIANIVEQRLHGTGHHTMMLDGDNVRHGLNRDLGFTEVDRVENIRRVGEVAKLMTEAGLIVLCSFISPYRAERIGVRNLVGDDEFVEVFVDAPLEECMRRDPKGLYVKARTGALKNFTGVDAPYEMPEEPEVHLRTVDETPEESADLVILALAKRGIV